MELREIYRHHDREPDYSSTARRGKIFRYRPRAHERVFDHGETDHPPPWALDANGRGSFELGWLAAECDHRAIGTDSFQSLQGRVGSSLHGAELSNAVSERGGEIRVASDAAFKINSAAGPPSILKAPDFLQPSAVPFGS